MKELIPVLVLATACACTKPVAKSPDSHSGHAVMMIPGVPHGICQSPVNIQTAAANASSHTVAIHYNAKDERVANLGHTVQVNFGGGGNIEFDGKRYLFKQFHFHTPSEHWLDGKSYPLEMHLVHTLDSNDEVYFVFSVLFQDGAADPLLASFLDAIPDAEGESTKLSDGKVNVATLFADNPGYYQYRGSLTTAPYTETVQWAIVQQVRTAAPEQVQAIMAVEGNNAREVQPLYGRPVEVN